MSAFGNRPLAYVCYLCGQQYGSQSLLIHVPQCAARWCQQHDAAAPPAAPAELPASADQLPRGADAIEAFNAAMMDYWQQAALERCPHCSRTFRLEALASHSKVCTAERPHKPLHKQQSGSVAAAGGGGRSGAGTSSSSKAGPQGLASSSAGSSAAGSGGSVFGAAGRMPRALVCYLCGGQFFAKSLPIHLPQCQAKWIQQQQLLPPSQRLPLPQPPAALEAVLGGDAPLPAAGKGLQEFNDAAFDTFNSASLVPCRACGRTFRPEALAHHAKHCTLEKPMSRR